MAVGSITGVVGQIKWSYYVAAAINGYTVTRTPEGVWRLTGAVIQSDAFKLTQRPLVFVAPHANGAWRWPILTCSIANGTVTASLGAPEI